MRGWGTAPIRRPARPRAGSRLRLFPPIQIGGHGRAAGRGRIVVPRERKCIPSCSYGSVALKTPRITSMASSVERVAFVEVDSERRELGLEIARRDPEDHAASGEPIEAQHRLGAQQRVPVREHHDVRLQLDARRRGRGERERDGRFERVVPARGEPLRVGRGVVGDEARIEAEPFDAGRALHDRGAGHEFLRELDPIRRETDAEAHAATRPGTRRSCRGRHASAHRDRSARSRRQPASSPPGCSTPRHSDRASDRWC